MREGKAQLAGMRSVGLALALRTTHAARRVRELVVADLGREQPAANPGPTPAAGVASIAVTLPPVVIVPTLEDELALLREGPAVVRAGRRFTVRTAETDDVQLEIVERQPGREDDPEGRETLPERNGAPPRAPLKPPAALSEKPAPPSPLGPLAAPPMEPGAQSLPLAAVEPPLPPLGPLAAPPVKPGAPQRESVEPCAPQPEPAQPAPSSPRKRWQAAAPAHRNWRWSEPWGFELQRRTSRAARRRRRRERPSLTPQIRRRRTLAGLATVALVAIAAGTLAAPTAHAPGSQLANRPRPSEYAKQTIPAYYMKVYWRVGEEYGLDWTKIAAVMQIESDHGRSELPGVHHGTNRAGAAGPAQFISGTWARYGVDADGSGHIDPYDPVDAVTAMAAYLKASGAPEHWRLALYTYNHSSTYVRAVMTLSRRFLGAPIIRGPLPRPM
jgi:hypothetical protein